MDHALDLARWMIEMQQSLKYQGNHVLSSTMARSMLTHVKSGYGLGTGVQTPSGKPAFSHTGGNEGYRCIYFAYESGDGAVVMTNSDNGDAVFAEILGSLAREYGWPDYLPQSRTVVIVPLAEQLSFVGRFKIKDGPPMEITATRTSLQLSINGDQPRDLFTSSSNAFFPVDDILQLSFDTPDEGVVIFGARKDPFERVKTARSRP